VLSIASAIGVDGVLAVTRDGLKVSGLHRHTGLVDRPRWPSLIVRVVWPRLRPRRSGRRCCRPVRPPWRARPKPRTCDSVRDREDDHTGDDHVTLAPPSSKHGWLHRLGRCGDPRPWLPTLAATLF
jgi:hypothetical protein